MSLIIEKQQSQWGQLKAALCPSKYFIMNNPGLSTKLYLKGLISHFAPSNQACMNWF